MNTTVWKFQLPLVDLASVVMPEGAEPLYVAAQHDVAWLWARVDPDKPFVTRSFRVAGTGHDLGDFTPLDHVGSFQLLGGDLVFHVFTVGH